MSFLSDKFRELAYVHRFHAERARNPIGASACLALAQSCEDLAGEAELLQRRGLSTDPLRRGHEALASLRGHLLRPPRGRDGVDLVLRAAVDMHDTTMGNVQLLDRSENTLRIVAHRNFSDDFLTCFRTVEARDDSACGRALRNGTQVVIDDVEVEPTFRLFRDVARAAGFRSVQSTPIFGQSGEVIGMISTHFARAGAPSSLDLKLAHLCALHASYQLTHQSVSA